MATLAPPASHPRRHRRPAELPVLSGVVVWSSWSSRYEAGLLRRGAPKCPSSKRSGRVMDRGTLDDSKAVGLLRILVFLHRLCGVLECLVGRKPIQAVRDEHHYQVLVHCWSSNESGLLRRWATCAHR